MPLTAGKAGDALHQFISFAIGDDQYGVDIMAVREIKGWSQINPLPGQPDYMRGVLNLRGAMVPIVDMRCRFGQGMTEATPLHVVIVTQIAGSHDRSAGRSGARYSRRRTRTELNRSRVSPRRRSVDFLSGLVTIESGMIALIDLSHILSVSIGEGAEIASAVRRHADDARQRASRRTSILQLEQCSTPGLQPIKATYQ